MGSTSTCPKVVDNALTPAVYLNLTSFITHVRYLQGCSVTLLVISLGWQDTSCRLVQMQV